MSDLRNLRCVWENECAFKKKYALVWPVAGDWPGGLGLDMWGFEDLRNECFYLNCHCFWSLCLDVS